MSVLCQLNDIEPNGGLEVNHSGQWIALFRVGDGVEAYRNVCPHQGRGLNFAPGEFLFTPDGLLVCPHHGATFELRTGACTEGPCKGSELTRIAITVVNGQVCLSP